MPRTQGTTPLLMCSAILPLLPGAGWPANPVWNKGTYLTFRFARRKIPLSAASNSAGSAALHACTLQRAWAPAKRHQTFKSAGIHDPASQRPRARHAPPIAPSSQQQRLRIEILRRAADCAGLPYPARLYLLYCRLSMYITSV